MSDFKNRHTGDEARLRDYYLVAAVRHPYDVLFCLEQNLAWGHGSGNGMPRCFRAGALTDQLVVIEAELADLATTRTTLLRLTGTDHAQALTDATVASPAYQQILAVFTADGNLLRARDICHALGTDTAAKNSESLRAKLRRLVNRSVLTEPEPGLFALAQPATSSPDPTPEP